MKIVFDEVSELSPELRTARLAELCPGDEPVRQEVERLLSELNGLGSFLENGYRGPLPPEPGPEFRFSPRDLLAGRFEILRSLGAGGMGEVYEARDLELNGKRIALKMIRQDLAADSRLERRFKQEVLAAREIVHPNVCPIYDVYQADTPSGPIRFLTMKLLEGKTVSQALQEAPIPPDEAIRLLAGIAEGLDAAHKAGIVHLDLKPANIILAGTGADPQPVITDFGLASNIRPSASLLDAGQSDAWGGSWDYMAPEQLLRGRVTPAADLYAFGILIFEIFSRRRPPLRNAETGVHEPVDWSQYPEIPSEFRKTIERCLSLDPASRFRTASEALQSAQSPSSPAAIRTRRYWLAFAAAAVIASLLLLPSSLRWWSVSSEPRHIVVLPFSNASGEPALDGVADGAAEFVAARLTRLESREKDYWVLSPTDARAGKVTNPATAGDILAANRVVEGRLLHASGQVRLLLHLREAPSAKLLGTRSINIADSDLPGLSARASDAALSLLGLTGSAVAAPAAASTANAEAFRLVESGKAGLRTRDEPSVERAVRELQQAVEVDPNYALGYAKLAEAYATRYHHTKQPEWMDLAARTIDRALQLQPSLSAVYVSAGLVYRIRGQLDASVGALHKALELDPLDAEAVLMLAGAYDRIGNPAEAEKAYDRLIALRPSYWLAYNTAGAFYAKQGKLDRAEKMFRYATQVAPANVSAWNNLGAIVLNAGRAVEAIEILRRSLSIRPTAQAYTNLGTAYFERRQYGAAAEAMRKAVELRPNEHVLLRNLGDAYSMLADKRSEAAACYRKAAQIAEQQLAVNEHHGPTLANLALYYAKLGSAAKAAGYLERSAREPQDPGLQLKQAIALELIGKRPQAIERLKSAFQQGLALRDVESQFELSKLREDRDYVTLAKSIVPAGGTR